jgi:dihydrodipicolinate synthase/N-acetylneuraminate lyase
MNTNLNARAHTIRKDTNLEISGDISEKRLNLLKQMAGEPIPRLWCPPLTHYTEDIEIDQKRMAAHWNFMSPYVNSFLIPGSTGDAWEMEDSEIRNLIDISLGLAGDYNSRILIGVLKSDAIGTLQGILEWLSMLKRKADTDNAIEAMKSWGVCGFTICPPRGSEITQENMEKELKIVLELGIPIVLYQLPQITENEMSASLVTSLTDKYSNLILLKDSSGGDRVALNSDGSRLPFLLRGAEGNYTQWLKESGGPYHGLLLSTANCFPRELKEIIVLLEDGRHKEAVNLSDKISSVIEQVFALVSDIPEGNAFTNANKALDHYMAYGKEARIIKPPMLHAGIPLPGEVITNAGDLLESSDLIPDKGYLE